MLAHAYQSRPFELLEMPADAFVRVLLGFNRQTGPDEKDPDPNDFQDFASYRMALIQRSRLQSNSIKSLVEKKAHALGLVATSAQTLNAVTVEGDAEHILLLLEDVNPATVVMERPQSLPSLSHPFPPLASEEAP